MAGAGYVTRSGSQLKLDGKPFYFMGANAYWLQDASNKNVDTFFWYAQSFGLKVIRLWAYNHNLPRGWGNYSQAEFKHLDYIVRAASFKNIKLVLALGNTWKAYRSPEDLLRMAGVNPNQTDLLGMYRSDRFEQFYRAHIMYVVNRVNSYTAVKYSEDNTIMMWDVLNEPRCPGCTGKNEEADHMGWLSRMADHVKSEAPHQLVATGTEGYFSDEANVRFNPGAGASCEGEDWVAISNLSSVDVATAHVYWRQMESIPPDWSKCNWECYFNFYQQYVHRHIWVAANMSKPFVVEEMNVIATKFTPEQRSAFFQLAADQLLLSKANNGLLMGVLFWTAAIGTNVWDDGYVIYLDGVTLPLDQLSSDSPASKSPAPDATAAEPDLRRRLGSAPEIDRGPEYVNKEGLDRFRRDDQRSACAHNVSKTWMPAWSTDAINASWYMERTKGKQVQQASSNVKQSTNINMSDAKDNTKSMMEDAKAQADKTATGMKEGAANMGDKTKDAAGDAKDAAGDMAAEDKSNLQKAGDAIKGAEYGQATGWSEGARVFAQAKDTSDPREIIMGIVADEAKKEADKGWPHVKEGATTVRNGTKEAANKAQKGVSKAKEAASEVGDKTKVAASQGLSSAKEGASDMRAAAKQAADKGLSNVKEGASDMSAAAKQAADKADKGTSNAKQAATEAGDKTKDAAAQGLSNVKEGATDVRNGTKEAVDEAGSTSNVKESASQATEGNADMGEAAKGKTYKAVAKEGLSNMREGATDVRNGTKEAIDKAGG
ncbi:hypothetical protein FOA52_003242 [Chlamydomonas sp. UWO 241]|nr:hypothetical protein FOA52_003242 [Chlamydomonas sp. UWO 241]